MHAIPIGRCRTARHSRAGAALVFFAALAGSACGLQVSTDAEARDEWKKQYSVSAGATIEIRNTNGSINVRAGEGSQVDVRATRIVRATTEEAAKAALADFRIEETAAPDRVVLNAAQSMGLTIGLSRSVEFDVTVPRTANVVLQSSNGDITASHLGGSFRATGTNGQVKADAMSGPVQVELTNGRVQVELAAVAESGVTCETTNGLITLTLPSDAKARLTARTSNGAISASDLDLAVTQQSRQRLDATIGGGGPAITLETTNGAIRVSGRRGDRR
jgi:DUF4097 and DUF4098 domain-containing protein YvlB